MELPSIYFAHDRDVVLRDQMWLAVGPFVEPRPGEKIERLRVRFRTWVTPTARARSSPRLRPSQSDRRDRSRERFGAWRDARRRPLQ